MTRFKSGRTAAIACGVVAMLAVSACSSAASTSSDGKSGDVRGIIKLGFVTSLTGPQAPGDSAAVAAAQARIKAANAVGGVNGRRLQLLVADDQSTPQGALTAAQSLVSRGVIAIETNHPEFEGPAEQYVSGRNIPIAALAADAAQVKDPNVFSVLGGSGPGVPGNTSLGKFLNGLHVTKMAGVAWGDLNAAVALMESPLKGAEQVGIRTVLTDLSPSPTTTNFTPDSLKIKASGAEGVFTAMNTPSNIALAGALRQQGVNLAGAVYSAPGYEASVLSDPGEAALEGTYVQYWFAPIELNTPATRAYEQTLAKYAPGTFGGLIETLAYVETDLFVTGLQHVRGAPTSASLRAALKSIHSYTGAGLTPAPVNLSLPNSAPSNLQRCYWYPEILHKKFVIKSAAPVCGDIVSS